MRNYCGIQSWDQKRLFCFVFVDQFDLYLVLLNIFIGCQMTPLWLEKCRALGFLLVVGRLHAVWSWRSQVSYFRIMSSFWDYGLSFRSREENSVLMNMYVYRLQNDSFHDVYHVCFLWIAT